MPGVDDDIVGQGHDLLAKAVIQDAGQVLLGHVRTFLGEIRTPDVAEEERVAREDGVRLALLVAEQVGRGFHRVAWGVQDLDGHLAHLEDLAVGGDVRIEGGIGVGAEHDGGVRFLRQGHVPGDKVGVEVRLEDVHDLLSTGFRAIEVRLDLPERVDDDGLITALDVVSALGQAAGIDLFDFHGGHSSEESQRESMWL